MKRRATANDKLSKKRQRTLEKQLKALHKAEAKRLEKERKAEAFRQKNIEYMRSRRRSDAMNNMINLMDNTSNHPSNNQTICNTVEYDTSTAMNSSNPPNESSSTIEINAASTSSTSAYANGASNEIQPPAPNIHECFESIKMESSPASKCIIILK